MNRDPDAENAAAAQSIADALMDGEIYPEPRNVPGSKLRQCARDAITIGDFLESRLDSADTNNALTAIVSGDSERIDASRDYLKRVCEGEVAAWVQEKFPQHVALYIEREREAAEERAAEDREWREYEATQCRA